MDMPTAQSVAIQSDGKIVAAGYSYNGTGTAFTLTRYNIDGSLDAGFYTGGKSQTSIDNFILQLGITIKENRVYIPGSSRFYGEVGAVHPFYWMVQLQFNYPVRVIKLYLRTQIYVQPL